VTVTYTPSQIGTEAVGIAYGDAPPFNIGDFLGTISMGAIQFTIPAPDQLNFRSLDLTLTPNAGGPGTGVLAVNLVNDINEAAWSATNLPSNQNTLVLYSATHTLTNGVAETIALNLGVTTPAPDQHVGGTATAMQVLGHSGFQGVVALVVTFLGSGVTMSFDQTACTLVGDEVPFLSGLPSGKPKLSRADWCPRCGVPLFREQLVEDGYTKTLVCPDCYDRAEQRYPPFKPPKEINP
jgi:hypothetical protein